MLLQIMNGTIDPSWVVVILAGVVAFFLIRTLNKIDSRIDKQEQRQNIITRVFLQMLTKIGGEDEDFYDDLRGQLNAKE